MRFGGLQKNTLIDYPGKISCVIFTSGCNFYCPYCHNPDLVGMSSSLYSEDFIIDFLKERQGWLDGVVISGGEPTLQEDIAIFCKKLKAIGYSIKLDTNGSNPEILKNLIMLGLVDYLAMDIKTDPYQYSPRITDSCPPEKILESIRIIMESGMPYEFKTTCVSPLINEEIMEKISRLIKGATIYALQKFQKEVVLHPEFFIINDYKIDEDAISKLKAIAESRVQRCIIR